MRLAVKYLTAFLALPAASRNRDQERDRNLDYGAAPDALAGRDQQLSVGAAERPEDRDRRVPHRAAADVPAPGRFPPHAIRLGDLRVGERQERSGAFAGFYPMVFFLRHEKIVQVNSGPDDFGVGAQYARRQCEQLGAPFRN